MRAEPVLGRRRTINHYYHMIVMVNDTSSVCLLLS